MRKLPVYERQHFPESVLGSNAPAAETAGKTLSSEDESIRLWTLDDEVLIASIKTKMHAIGGGVIEGLLQAQELAEKDYKGLVIWSPDEMFSAGADLQGMMPAFIMGGAKAIEGAEAELQNAMLKLRYSNVPVVSAVRGLALGGGCELAVYSSKRVVAHGKLHRSGRSRRGPGARRRWPDLHRAPCGREHGHCPRPRTCCLS